jgi:hypothetical protein
MAININYHKRKNSNLFQKMQQHQGIQLTNIQNYIPIYNTLFSLNENNYNSINLNYNWDIHDIKENNLDSEFIFNCRLKNNIVDTIFCNQKVFFKMAPLLDPFKYIIGKYDCNDINLFNLPLPLFLNKTNIHPKLLDSNNSSYIDGFFAYLTSKLYNDKNFIHGINYFGSFLAIKHNFKINVIDDIDYLIKSDFFNKNKNILFQVEDYSHIINEVPVGLTPIKIFNDEEIELDIINMDLENEKDLLEETKLGSQDKQYIELEDITNSNHFQLENNNKTTLKSDSTCSSRTSHTSLDNDFDDKKSNEDDNNDEKNSECSICEEDQISNTSYDTVSDGSSNSFDDEKLNVTIPEFPIQMICIENCDETLDDFIINNENNISNDEWFSIFMQIIMILITYQKIFSFTHNDLHTNNIMYVKTEIKYIFYIYKKKCYKVPTFGKIYKIIDFGRAIYKFNGKLYCSDSFQVGEDAATQYNTEPYYNDKKPRLEPNYSFDLCRLACSIFDYVVDDFDNIKQLKESNPVINLIVEWCLDDNGINVLYKNNGIERYPDFKLYKMIARCVHNHVPSLQLNRPEFKKYIISKINIPKGNDIINIDELS